MSHLRAEDIGQLLFIELEDYRWNASCERVLRAWAPGGVLLSARCLRTPGLIAELLSRIAATLPAPPLLALEEEGGRVDPLRAFFPSLPSPQATAERGPPAAEHLGELIGAALSFLGFNTNLAPLLDIPAPSRESKLGTRAFSADPGVVAKCGGAFLHGLQRHGILPCGKHFPGLGSAQVDRHAKLPLVDKTMTALWRQDLVPYRELLHQLPLVMIGYAAYKAYDFDTPVAALQSSRVVEDLLRLKLNYRGVAVADDLPAEAVRRVHDPPEAPIKSLNAGCDLLRVKGDGRVVESVLRALKKGLAWGTVSAKRPGEALERLRRARKGLERPRGRISTRAFERLIREFEDFAKDYCVREEKIAWER